jgi:drug/metabolite transporter (DMT)-like permease
MTGEIWAILAGTGFGMFQSLNRRAVQGMDVYLATFLQLFISALVLVAISVLTIDLRILAQVSPLALLNFALAGFFHFFIGWTFLNTSQKRIGAARTSPLIGTTPLFGAGLAALTLGEVPGWLSLLGIFLIIGGVVLISKYSNGATNNPASSSAGAATAGWTSSIPGLAAALCWAISPLFIRQGLKDFPSPLIGVTIGILASVIAYAIPLFIRRKQSLLASATRDALTFKIAAGVLVGLSTWIRWIALDMTSIASVLALSLVSIPVVIILSPLIMGRQLERITASLLAGAALIIAGALVLIFIA